MWLTYVKKRVTGWWAGGWARQFREEDPLYIPELATTSIWPPDPLTAAPKIVSAPSALLGPTLSSCPGWTHTDTHATAVIYHHVVATFVATSLTSAAPRSLPLPAWWGKVKGLWIFSPLYGQVSPQRVTFLFTYVCACVHKKLWGYHLWVLLLSLRPLQPVHIPVRGRQPLVT